MTDPSAGQPPRLLFITDPAWGDGPTIRCVKAIAAQLPPGALAVQLRDKRRGETSLRVFAWELRAVTRASRAWLIVNGNPTVARDVGAEGVHLGYGAGSIAQARARFARPCWVSVSAHSDDDVRRALDEGADAVLVSPVFATRSRGPDGQTKMPRGLDGVRSARRFAGRRMLVYALGGVSALSARECAAAGADGAAVMRALVDATDPAAEARAIHDAWAGCW